MAKKKGKKAQEQREDPGLDSPPKSSKNAHPSPCLPITTRSIVHHGGTGAVKLHPYIEYTSNGVFEPFQDHYETITAQPECSTFSLEELRLADYQHREEALLNTSAIKPATTPTLLLQPLPRSNSKKHSCHLDLLRGPGIEVHVGIQTPVHDLAGINTCGIWSLPKGLISHYSPFLEAACSRDFKERRENRIELQDDDATVFALFVEWMYYGDYGIAPLSLPLVDSFGSANADAKCWILGDKLLCTDCKNHAMSRLYAEHTAAIFNRVVTISDVQYACSNSNAHSKLRKLYVALVATHFSNPSRIHGSAEEWDSLILEHADMRLLLLKSFRLDAKDRDFLKSKEHYLDDNADLAGAQPNP